MYSPYKSIELSAADKQDLAELIERFACWGGSCHRGLDRLIERFNIPPEDASGYESSCSIKARVDSLVNSLNGTTKLFEVVNYVIHEGWWDLYKDKERKKIENIFFKYGFKIDLTQENPLVPIYPGHSQKEQEKMMSWLEKNANPKVLEFLESAKNKISVGKTGDALGDCRKALEALTTKGVFSDGIIELVNQNIISQGDHKRKKDAELLKAIYGFTSTLGSHTSSESVEPDIEQALLGLFVTESAVYFLLRRIKVGKDVGKQLQSWVLI